MKLISGTLYLSIEELSTYGFTRHFLNNACYEYRTRIRPSYMNIPDPDDKRICLVSYDSIPEATIREKGIPDKAVLIGQGIIREQLVLDPVALDHYLTNPNSHQKAKEYQLAAAYLMLAAPVTVSTVREVGFTGVDGFYSTIMDMMIREKMDVWHISNLDRFKRRLSPFKTAIKQPSNKGLYIEALSSLISKKYGLKNAAKVASQADQAEEMQATILQIYAKPQKFSLEETEMAYLKIAAKKHQEWIETEGKAGWDHKCFITGQTMANFLYDPKNQQLWYGSRHGNGEYKNNFERNTKRLQASYANAKWVIDGTPLHRYFQDGDSAYNRVHIFFVMDEYSWCILGVGISLSGESSGQVLQALRAASQNAGLYAGTDMLYVPFEVQSDNSSANKSESVVSSFRTIGSVHRPAAVGNSKAKVVEPLNKHFFSRWMKFREGFTGSMGMSTTVNTKINQDSLTEIVKRKQLPDLARTLEELQQDVMNWNNDRSWKNKGLAEELCLSPLEKYRASVLATTEKQKTITDSLSVNAFYWMPTKAKQEKDTSGKTRKSKTVHYPQEYKYTNNGIKVERISPMDGKKIMMEFDVPDAAFNAENIGRLFTLRIEPLNYDHAFLFCDGKPVTDQEGRWIKAVNKEAFHSAVADHNEGEMSKILTHEAIKKDQKKLSVSRMEYFDLKAQRAGIDTDEIKNPRLFGQKEVSDALKIAATERIANGTKYHIEEPVEVEAPVIKKQSTIKRFEI